MSRQPLKASSANIPPVRVVIDTSTALPLLTRPRPQGNWLWIAAKRRLIVPVGNRETDEELRHELLEWHAKKHGGNAYLYARRDFTLYEQHREIITAAPSSKTPQCRDSNDQMFIDLAYAAAAGYLLTRDDDLLSMNGQTPFVIVHDHAARDLLWPNDSA